MGIRRAAGVLIVSLSTLLTATLLTACEDGGGGSRFGFAAPTAPFSGSPFVSASLFPPTIGFTSVAGFRCPTTAPFFSSFSLFIDQSGGIDIFLDQVQFQFADDGGRRSALLLSRTDLAAMFGSTLVAGGASRTFDFRSQFGCGLLSLPSSLFVDFITLNRSGISHQSTLNAVLR